MPGASTDSPGSSPTVSDGFSLPIQEKPLMTKPPVAVNQTLCQIIELNYSLAISPCDQCGQPAARFTTATRTAIDLHLEHRVLLHLTVSVHHCCLCRHFFRAQPPFLRTWSDVYQPDGGQPRRWQRFTRIRWPFGSLSS